MSQRTTFSSGSAWERRYGYARAVREGDYVFVSGTTAVREGQVVGRGDPALQTECIFEIVQEALQALGAELADVVRVRILRTDISRADEIGMVMGAVFRDVGRQPAATMVEVSRLIDPALLVEVEVDAIASPGGP